MKAPWLRGMLFVSFILAIAGTAPAEGLSIEARGAYFSPADKVFREIYGYGISWGGELSFSVSKRGAIWAGGDYYSKVGKLGFTQDETKIRIVPLAAGLKYYFSEGRLRPYAGAGAAYFQYKETNSIGTIEKGDLGFVARAGLLVMLGPTFFIDIQGSWSSCSVQPAEVKANLGGLSLGLGLGFEF
jgi:opacity protein-like surface antigen